MYIGWTSLISAAWGGHQTVVQTLLLNGADINDVDNDGLFKNLAFPSLVGFFTH